MNGELIVTVELSDTVATNQNLLLVRDLAALDTPYYISSEISPLPENLVMPYSSIFPVPPNAAIVEIISAGAYFFPANELEFNRARFNELDKQKIMAALDSPSFLIVSNVNKRVSVRIRYA